MMEIGESVEVIINKIEKRLGDPDRREAFGQKSAHWKGKQFNNWVMRLDKLLDQMVEVPVDKEWLEEVKAWQKYLWNERDKCWLEEFGNDSDEMDNQEYESGFQ